MTPVQHARCPACGSLYAVRLNGVMREHRSLGPTDLGSPRPPLCPGSGQYPSVETVEARLPACCPGCGRVMSFREEDEQGACNDCSGGAR